MRVFVSGGGGFLGRHLIKALQVMGAEITAPSSSQCDLTQETSLARYTDAYDHIYHLAAWTQAGDFCLRFPGDQWLVNQKINTNVLSWWISQQSQAKMICIGTSCAYPEDGPLVESRYMHGEPTSSLYTYALTKRMLVQGLRAIQLQYGLAWLCVVPSTLYGVGYHSGDKQLHFIFDLIRKIKIASRGGERAELWGDGYQRRELIHVTDFVRDLLLLNNLVQNEIVNIGAGEDHTIRGFASLICSHLKYDENLIAYDETKYVGAKQKLLDISKLTSMIGKPYRVKLDDGIAMIIEDNNG